MESASEFKFVRELSDLREPILEYVRGPSAVFPGLPFVQEFKRDDIGLSAAVAAATERLARVRNAQNECSTVRQQFDAAKAEHQESQKPLARLYKALGAAVLAAFKAGEIPRQQDFAERIAVDERITRLKMEQEALAAPPDAGIVGRAKVGTQRLALAAKITAAQFSAGKLDAQIGKRLIDSRREDSVRSASTAEVLDDLASTRRDIASCNRDFDLAAKLLASAKTALSQALGVSQTEGETAVAARIGELQEELATNQRRLRTREREFLDILVTNASSFADTPIGTPLKRLIDLRPEEQAALARNHSMIGKSWVDFWTRDIVTGLTPEETRQQEERRRAELAARPKVVPCKACGREISPEADACIHCGQPMNTAVKCPNCKSRNVFKISMATKVVTVMLIGLFAVVPLSKTYQCNDCGFRW